MSIEDFSREKLKSLQARGLERRLFPTIRREGMQVERAGRRLISFSDNDYLGLTQDERLMDAAQGAMDDYGAGAGASRLVTGECPLYADLEKATARWKETEAALVFGSGFLANAGTMGVFAGDGDLLLLDELSHASMYAGARLSQADIKSFPHNDLAALEAILKRERQGYGNCLVATEGVFSMDGDRAAVADMLALCNAHDAWLFVDDAHGLGVVEDGRGAGHGGGAPLPVHIQTGTYSKAAGGYGGYVAASQPAVDLLKNRARSLVYTTGLPPAVLAANLAGMKVMAKESGLRREALRLARLFTDRLGLAPAESAIVPLIIGAAEKALDAQAALEEEGFLVVAIRPPTVPEGTARLRLSFSAAHKEADVKRLADAVRTLGLGA